MPSGASCPAGEASTEGSSGWKGTLGTSRGKRTPVLQQALAIVTSGTFYEASPRLGIQTWKFQVGDLGVLLPLSLYTKLLRRQAGVTLQGYQVMLSRGGCRM